MEGAWRNKLAAGFTASASRNGDKHTRSTSSSRSPMQHGMIWVGLGLQPGYNHSKGSIQDLNRLGRPVGAMAQANADQGAEGIAASDFNTMEAWASVSLWPPGVGRRSRSPKQRNWLGGCIRQVV